MLRSVRFRWVRIVNGAVDKRAVSVLDGWLVGGSPRGGGDLSLSKLTMLSAFFVWYYHYMGAATVVCILIGTMFASGPRR